MAELRLPRRPAILSPARAEAIVGDEDPAVASGIAHSTAWALLGIPDKDFDLEASLTPEKLEFALETADRTLADAMKGADMFLGLSKPGVVTKEMVVLMNDEPIIFALANPTPEIFQIGRAHV